MRANNVARAHRQGVRAGAAAPARASCCSWAARSRSIIAAACARCIERDSALAEQVDRRRPQGQPARGRDRRAVHADPRAAPAGRARPALHHHRAEDRHRPRAHRRPRRQHRRARARAERRAAAQALRRPAAHGASEAQGMVQEALDAFVAADAERAAAGASRRDRNVDALLRADLPRAADLHDGGPAQHLPRDAPAVRSPSTSSASATTPPTSPRWSSTWSRARTSATSASSPTPATPRRASRLRYASDSPWGRRGTGNSPASAASLESRRPQTIRAAALTIRHIFRARSLSARSERLRAHEFPRSRLARAGIRSPRGHSIDVTPEGHPRNQADATQPKGCRADNGTCAKSSGGEVGRCGCRSRWPGPGAELARERGESRGGDLQCPTPPGPRSTLAVPCR